eukprot:3939641-Rhodomonas_salina.2
MSGTEPAYLVPGCSWRGRSKGSTTDRAGTKTPYRPTPYAILKLVYGAMRLPCVWCYAVLPYLSLRVRYAVSGTDYAYGPTDCMGGHMSVPPPFSSVLSCYACATRFSRLGCMCYAMSGTEIGYAATRQSPTDARGTIRYRATRLLCDVRY